MPVVVKAGTNDVGELHRTAGATFEGIVLLPPGVRPLGLEVTIGERGDQEHSPLDSGSRFRCEDLAATTHTFDLAPQPGLVAAGASATVELTASETHALTIDAQNHGMTEVVLTVLLEGRPAIGCSVGLIGLAAENRPRLWLGKCDDEGRVSKFVRAWGEAGVTVTLESGQQIEHIDSIQLLPSERISATRSFELAALQLRFPPSVTFPSSGRIVLELVPLDDTGPTQVVNLHGRDGEWPAEGPGVFTAPSELRFESLPVGRWRLTAEVHDGFPTIVLQPDAQGNARPVREPTMPTYRASADANLVAGEATTVTLD